MERSPSSEANSHSASQEIPRLLWNLKIHYRVHNSPSLDPIPIHIRGRFEKFVDSPYYSESELCGGAVTVSLSKYLPWQAMLFLQRSTNLSKTCCRTFAESFRRIAEQEILITSKFLLKRFHRLQIADILIASSP
jgi:hypothetical protein